MNAGRKKEEKGPPVREHRRANQGDGLTTHHQKFNTELEDLQMKKKITGSVLSALHLYEPLVDYAGAGASVPLIGFGHLLFQGVKEEVEQVGILGVFTGGLKASAGGISAALIFGYLASLFFHPQMKK